jgi:hypothetical protein
MIRHLPVLALLLLAAGCATAANGPLQRIHVESNPRGATVRMSGCGRVDHDSVTTPATVWVSRGSTRCRIELSIPGEPAQVVRLHRQLAHLDESLEAGDLIMNSCCDSFGELFAGFAVAAIVAGIGSGIDYSTGALFEQVPNCVSIDFDEYREDARPDGAPESYDPRAGEMSECDEVPAGEAAPEEPLGDDEPQDARPPLR